MKFRYTILIFLVSIPCWSQTFQNPYEDSDSIEVSLVYRFHCNDSIATIKDFALKLVNEPDDLIKDYRVNISQNGACIVPKMG